MSLLNATDIKFLEHIVGKDFATKWKGIKQKNSSKDVVTIANTGLFSSGKSMLFNALLDRTEKERFQVGAAPTTKKGDREKLNAQIEIIDTPGINANDADDDEAFRSLMEADIILAVHNIKTGMLDKCEYEWLKRIAGEMGKEEIKQRMAFVCTWIDESGTKEETEKKVAEIKRQLREILHTDIDFWEISSKRYYTAKEKQKAELEKASKVPQLKEYLVKKSEEYVVISEELRKKEVLALCRQTKKSLQNERNLIFTQISRKRENICKKYDYRKNTWAGILGNFKDYRMTVWEKLKKVREEDEEYAEFEKYIKNI